MSSPYQSKLFNFLNRQSQQWRDRAVTAARHLKVAAEWGVQILLYPIYLTVQAGRMAGRQVGQAAVQSQLPAASSTAESSPQTATPDLPIQRVLTAIEPWLSLPETQAKKEINFFWRGELGFRSQLMKVGITPTQETASSLQGVASLLETRRLVLVAPENRILDILSPQQQQQLLKGIRAEVANYWHDLRLNQAKELQFPGLIPSYAENSPNVLPPARIFWKAMGWLQNRISPPQSQLQIFLASYLEGLDRRLADWEAKPSNPVKVLVRQVSQQLQGLVEQESRISDKLAFLRPIKARFQEIQPFALKRVGESPGIVPNLAQGTAIASDRAELDPFQIQALIQAGIDYFFGQRREKKQLSGDREALSLAGSEPTVEDPWLLWEDLFPEQLPERAIAVELDEIQSLSPPLPEGLPTPARPGTSWRESLRQNWRQFRQSNALQTRPQVSKKLARQQAKTGTVTPSYKSPNAVVPVSETEESLETAFDWVEAKVTPAGYVKHPLEQILQWLDLFILWLEKSIAKGWHWLRQRLEF